MAPRCLPPEGDIVVHAWREAILSMACSYDVQVSKEVSGEFAYCPLPTLLGEGFPLSHLPPVHAIAH